MGRVHSTRKGATNWTKEEDEMLHAIYGQKEKLRGKLKEVDFWAIIGNDFRPPITSSAAMKRWKRIEEMNKAAEEKAKQANSQPTETSTGARRKYIDERLDRIEGKLDWIIALWSDQSTTED